MKRMPTAKAFMTPFPFSISDTAPLAEAQDFMREQGIRHLPVLANGKLAGLITDRDIKLLLGPEFGSPDARDLTVGEAMLPEPYVADLNTPLDVVLKHMVARHIGSAVITRKGQLAGMLTTTDVCLALGRLLQERFGGGGDEAA